MNPTQTPESNLAQVPASTDAAQTQPTPATLRQEAEAADWLLRRTGSLEPEAGFLPKSRRRLEVRLSNQARRTWWHRLWATPHLRFAANAASIALLVVIMATFLSVLTTAARVALPGEALFTVKLGIEQLRLGLSVSEVQRAEMHVAFAQQRSNELQALMIEGDYAHVEMASWRMLMEVEAARRSLALAVDLDQAQRLRLVQSLNQTLEMQHLVMRALLTITPAESKPIVQHILLFTN